MTTAYDPTAPFPLDWNAWNAQWHQWLTDHSDRLSPTLNRFPGKNFMADDILGTYEINGRTVELSEVTFPNLTDRDDAGRLIRRTDRGIGITYATGVDAATTTGGVVHSFAELDAELFQFQPGDRVMSGEYEGVIRAVDPSGMFVVRFSRGDALRPASELRKI